MKNTTAETLYNAMVNHEAQLDVLDFLAERDWMYTDELTEAYGFLDTERDNEEKEER